MRPPQKIVHADDEDATSSLDDDSHFAPDSYVEDIQAERDGILPEVRKMMKRLACVYWTMNTTLTLNLIQDIQK